MRYNALFPCVNQRCDNWDALCSAKGMRNSGNDSRLFVWWSQRTRSCMRTRRHLASRWRRVRRQRHALSGAASYNERNSGWRDLVSASLFLKAILNDISVPWYTCGWYCSSLSHRLTGCPRAGSTQQLAASQFRFWSSCLECLSVHHLTLSESGPNRPYATYDG